MSGGTAHPTCCNSTLRVPEHLRNVGASVAVTVLRCDAKETVEDVGSYFRGLTHPLCLMLRVREAAEDVHEADESLYSAPHNRM